MNKNIEFLKQLSKKTMYEARYTLTPNISKRSFTSKCMEFTSQALTVEEFEKILSIVEEELLLIFPKEGFMGYVEGFEVRDFDGKLIIMFGKTNLPDGYDKQILEEIFNKYCKSDQNVTILNEIQKEGNLRVYSLKENFSDYCY